MRYTYDASGNKSIRAVDGADYQNNNRLDYSGNFIYENDDRKAILTSVGRIVPLYSDGSTYYMSTIYRIIQETQIVGYLLPSTEMVGSSPQ